LKEKIQDGAVAVKPVDVGVRLQHGDRRKLAAPAIHAFTNRSEMALFQHKLQLFGALKEACFAAAGSN
jgi:hypothetical protein